MDKGEKNNILNKEIFFSKKDLIENNFFKEKLNLENKTQKIIPLEINNFKEKNLNLSIPTNIQNKQINILYNPNFAIPNVIPQGGFQMDMFKPITADSIPEFAFPIAQFIEQVKPD